MIDKFQSFEFLFPRPGIRSARARQVARLFSLPSRGKAQSRPGSFAQPIIPSLLPREGQITFLTGPSGAGKSTLLRAVRARLVPNQIVDLETLELPNKPLVDLFPDLTLQQALKNLNRAGLAEAWTYLRSPRQLSAGQFWRLRLAIALHRARALPGAMLICDEFTSLLDRITACIISRALRKSIRAPLRAIVATSHDDIESALQPDIVACCDFGQITISRTLPAPMETRADGDGQ